MRFGINLDFRNPPAHRRDPTELYRALLEQAVLADELGFDHVWLTEHHFTDDGYNPSVLAAAAAIAARTTRARIGTFVLILPFHDPVRVAEDATFVDILSGGRFDLGVGQGYTHDEFRALSLPRSERAARMEEGLELIRRLWTEEEVTFEGRFRRVDGASLSPRPVQQPHPPIWIGARGPKAIARAARLGAHLLTTLGPDPAPEYLTRLRDAGRDPDRYRVAQLRLLYCAPSEEQAWDDVSEHLHAAMGYYGRVMAEAGDVPGDDRLWTFDEPSQIRASGLARAALIGTPDQVHSRLERLLERLVATDLICTVQLAGMDPARSSAAMRLFAQEVMPAFR